MSWHGIQVSCSCRTFWFPVVIDVAEDSRDEPLPERLGHEQGGDKGAAFHLATLDFVLVTRPHYLPPCEEA